MTHIDVILVPDVLQSINQICYTYIHTHTYNYTHTYIYIQLCAYILCWYDNNYHHLGCHTSTVTCEPPFYQPSRAHWSSWPPPLELWIPPSGSNLWRWWWSPDTRLMEINILHKKHHNMAQETLIFIVWECMGSIHFGGTMWRYWGKLREATAQMEMGMDCPRLSMGERPGKVLNFWTISFCQ